jgi:hypothetical protein
MSEPRTNENNTRTTCMSLRLFELFFKKGEREGKEGEGGGG